MTKIYTLELTADELFACARGIGIREECVRDKVLPLIEQAESDRELRLPWGSDGCNVTFPSLRPGEASCMTDTRTPSERAAKLMSAAPELLDVVEAVEETIDGNERTPGKVLKLISRARKKIATGIPEGQ